MTNAVNKQKPWYVSLREHLLDPMVRSSAPGSIGRLFSTSSFFMCCKYWLSNADNLAKHEAPSTLLQVFFWTTGYVFANTVVKVTSGHMDKKLQLATVPAIPDLKGMTAAGISAQSADTGDDDEATPVVPAVPKVASKPATVPTKPAASVAPIAPLAKPTPAPAPADATTVADAGGDEVTESDAG